MTTNLENTGKTFAEYRFEFILYINEHIICQRFFDIRNYNEKVLNSYEIKELVDNIVGMNNGDWGSMGIIPNYLKKKSIDYTWDGYDPYYIKEEEVKNLFEKLDDFQFEIKVDKRTVVKSGFSGNFFPPKVRYAVDVRKIIPEIMSEIRDFFSEKNYTEVVV